MKGIVTNNKGKIKYLFIYTILFSFVFFICYGQWFIKYDKAFFRSYDGLDQHYLIFLYIGKWGREIIREILFNHRFSVKLWDMGIGYGSDVITSIGAYLPDPFNWLSILVPAKYAEQAYAVTIILKFYVSGLAFSYFAYSRKLTKNQALIGSVLYVFSATSLVFFSEPFLLNPMYLFPLVIVGFDRIWENSKNYKLYIIFLALIFINYFYFGYMTAILVVGYFVIKYIFDDKIEHNVKKFFELVTRYLVYSLIAVGISMAVVLPITLVMLQVKRIGADFYVPLLFDKTYNIGLLSGFTTSYGMLGRDCYIGYGALALVAVSILFMKKNQYKQIKIEFIILTVGLAIPYFGKVMNGFGYTANRWVWAYVLLVAYIVSITIDLVRQLSINEKFILAICLLGYIVLVCSVYSKTSRCLEVVACMFIALLIIIAYVDNWTEKKFNLVFCVMMILSVFANNYYTFDSKYGNFLKPWVSKNTGFKEIYESTINNTLTEIDYNAGQRYDSFNMHKIRNCSWLYGISGMDFYISIYNNNIDEYHNDISLLTSSAPMSYRGLNRRSDLEYIMGVNHFLVPKDNEKGLPYGYSIMEVAVNSESKEYRSYTTSYDNSIIHGVNGIISSEEYNKFNPYEKQQVIMQVGVVDEVKNSDIVNSVNLDDDEIEYSIEYSNNININGNEIEVREDNTPIYLCFSEIKDSELYVQFNNIDYIYGTESMYSISLAGMYNDDKISFLNSSFSMSNNRNHMYGGRHNWMFNLGITRDKVNRVEILFSKKGKYTIDDIKVFAEPLRRIENNIEGLPSIADDIVVANNGISFDLENNDNKYMIISVPYSKGWKAYVDGKKRDIRICDGAFMIMSIEDGDHHVEMKYFPPGFLSGIVLSIISLIAFALIKKVNIK